MQAKVADQISLEETYCVEISPQHGTYFVHLEICTTLSLDRLFSAELNNVKHISLGWSSASVSNLVQFRLRSLSPYSAYLQCISGRASAAWIDTGAGAWVSEVPEVILQEH